MPSASRHGDGIYTGHACSPTSTIIATQGVVRINGIPAARMGDPIAPHTILVGIYCVPHSAFVNRGSRNVRIVGRSAARIGDSADMARVAQGSRNVRIGSVFSIAEKKKKHWESIKKDLADANIDWLGGGVYTDIRDKSLDVVKYVDKWYPNHGLDRDLIQHYGSTLLLKEKFGGVGAALASTSKEFVDFYTSTVGFSTDDLAANLAAYGGYDIEEAMAAGLFEHTDSEYGLGEGDGWVDNGKKIMNLIDPEVTQTKEEKIESKKLWNDVLTAKNFIDK
jgi:uncharacterized Zn-binding protein involved in type VI secretion